MARKPDNRWKVFAAEYAAEFNAMQAAKAAGYSPRRAKQTGFELLQRPEVMAEVRRLIEERQKRREVTVEYVLDSLVTVLERCKQAEQVLDREGNPTGEYRFDSGGANRAAELLGKHLAMFTEKVKHEGEVGLRNLTDEQLDAEIARYLTESGLAGATH